MEQIEHLAARFEENRGHLRGVAYRMLGSLSEADDAVQEAWLRLSRSDSSEIQNLSGWLTTVVARVCLDILRSRKSRREESLEPQSPAAQFPDSTTIRAHPSDPEQEAMLADSVGLALLVVLDTLTPAERLAFVLHDLFDLSFDEIARVLGRSPTAARQLASRARRRVRGGATVNDSLRAVQRSVVDSFISALRGGDFDGLVAVLDPDLVVRADSVVAPPAGREVRGATTWAKGAIAFSRAIGAGAQPALINGSVGIVIAPRGRLFRVLSFTFNEDKIVHVDVIADPERLRQLEIAVLED